MRETLRFWSGRRFRPARRIHEHDVELRPGSEAPTLEGPLRLLCWNIHFGAGAALNDARRFPPQEVLANLVSIAAVARELNAEVLVLQEVDRLADRSARIDQLQRLRELSGLEHAAFAMTWDAAWVPYPIFARPNAQYGRVLSGQAVLSRYPIAGHRRVALPQPGRYGRVHNHFYLHRCAQEVVLELGGRSLTLVNVHLEAFDLANRRLHVRQLAAQLQSAAGPTLCLGDFNAIPPEAAQQHTFEDEPSADHQGDDSLEVLRALGWAELGDGGLTFPSWRPDRRLDHVFASPGLRARGGTVPPLAECASDHLPLYLEVDV